MSTATGEVQLSPEAVFAAVGATWPPGAWHEVPGWRVAEGRGGGKRVSAARPTGPQADPEVMEAAHRRLGQPALAMLRPRDAALDAVLDARGYARIDPTVALVAPVAMLSTPPPPLTVFEVPWPPLKVQAEIWNASGIGPERRAVMARVTGPRITLMGRRDDTPSATAFLACDGDVAVIHALEVAPAFRRKGQGLHLMAGAALWAERQGARLLMALVTEANVPAIRLYGRLGMTRVAGYHYRLKPEETR